MMRLGILADIHGNPIALDAVLNDIEKQGGVDGYLVLGDLAANGYDPVGVLERLVSLPNTRIIRGNTERYLVTSERPWPIVEDVRANLDLLPRFGEVAESFAWSQGYLEEAKWLNWLAALPPEERLVLPDGKRLLGVHATPGTDDGHGIHPLLSDDELGDLLVGCEADLVCVAHTHLPLDRSVGGVRVVNAGSVSNPVTADTRAGYAVLFADESGYRLDFRRVGYDNEAVVDAIRRSRHPAAAFLTRFMRGETRSRWSRQLEERKGS